MEEEWRVIPDHPDYQVSESGRIKSNFTGREKVPHVNQGGYWQVSLQVNKRCRLLRIHRLVAFAFLEGPRGPVVRHLDGNQKNNHFTNLAWGTQRDNWYDAKGHGTAYIRPEEEFCKRGHLLSDDPYMAQTASGPERRCRACWTTYNRTQLDRRAAYDRGTLTPTRRCARAGCDRAHYAKDLCRPHYRSSFDKQAAKRQGERDAAHSAYMAAIARAGTGVLSNQDAYG